MAKIVDKEQKRRDIALSCKNLFLSKGIKDVTISQMAQSASVGKGTIYEYFKNKEEVVFEIVNILMQEHAMKLSRELQTLSSTKEKIKKFSEFFYSAQDLELRTFYKNFISITLTSENTEMREFQTQSMQEYYKWFVEILQDGIDAGELQKEIMGLSLGLFVTGKGLFMISETTDSISNLQEQLNAFIDNLFALMEVKK